MPTRELSPSDTALPLIALGSMDVLLGGLKPAPRCPGQGLGRRSIPREWDIPTIPHTAGGGLSHAETTLPLWSIRDSELWEGVKKTVPENNPLLQEQGCTISLPLKNAIINYFSISAPPFFFADFELGISPGTLQNQAFNPGLCCGADGAVGIRETILGRLFLGGGGACLGLKAMVTETDGSYLKAKSAKSSCHSSRDH